MLRIVREVGPDLAFIITLMPRYLDACCEQHGVGKSAAEWEADRQRILKAVWAMKRESFALVAKDHVKNVVVLSPMEELGLRSDVEEVRAHMADGLHLDERVLDTVVDSLLKRTEEHLLSKKRGPTERSGPDTKRPCMASDGRLSGRGGRGFRGSRGGRGGVSETWRYRSFSNY